MADIFISYARPDRALADKLAHALEAVGLSVWWDKRIKPAEQWDTEIETELKSAGAVIVLWSPVSVESRWVRTEADYAQAKGKLVPIRVEPCEPPVAFRLMQSAELPAAAIRAPHLDAHPGFSAALQAARAIVQATRSRSSADVIAAEAALRAKQARAAQSKFIGLIVLAALGLTGVAGYIWYGRVQAAGVRAAKVTADGIGLSLAQLAARKTSEKASTEPFGFVSLSGERGRPLHSIGATSLMFGDASVACSPDGGPCSIAAAEVMSALQTTPGDTPGKTFSHRRDAAVVLNAAGDALFAFDDGKAATRIDLGLACAGAAKPCGATAVSGAVLKANVSGLPLYLTGESVERIYIGLSDGSVGAVERDGKFTNLMKLKGQDSPVTSVAATQNAIAFTLADGRIGYGTYASYLEPLTKTSHVGLGQMNVALPPSPHPNAAPCRPMSAAPFANGLGLAVRCEGKDHMDTRRQIQVFKRDTVGAQFTAVSDEYYHSGPRVRTALKDRFVIFSPDAQKDLVSNTMTVGGLAIIDTTTGKVSDFQDGMAADCAILRGRAVAAVLNDNGVLKLIDLERRSLLASIELDGHVYPGQRKNITGDVRIHNGAILVSAIARPVERPNVLSNWTATDPAGPLF